MEAARKRKGFSTAPEGKNRPGSLTPAYIETEHVVLLQKDLLKQGTDLCTATEDSYLIVSSRTPNPFVGWKEALPNQRTTRPTDMTRALCA